MRGLYITALILTGLLFQFASCDQIMRSEEDDEKKIDEVSSDGVFDMEPEYPTVQIGDQIWMSYNLNTATFRNGDSIPVFHDGHELNEFGKNKKPAAAFFDNNPEIGEITGRLYNWYAVTDPRGICPTGFRVPTADDLYDLLTFVGEDEYYDPKKAMRELSKGGSSGFNAKYGGWCCMNVIDEDDNILDFVNFGNNAAYWSSTKSDEESADILYKTAINIDIGTTMRSDSYGAYIDDSSVSFAFSVRCIKDKE